MPGPSLTTEALVLLKHPPAESFQSFTLLSPEHGVMLVRQRTSRKSTAAPPALDLFDNAAFLLETAQQGWFVKEARVLRHRDGIGRYETLLHASRLATLVACNARLIEAPVRLHALVEQALDAFAVSDRPDIVYLKSLYRFARDEGHPVREQWQPTLAPADRLLLTEVLHQPLAAQTAPPAAVTRLRQRLETYLQGHTEIQTSTD